MLYPKITSEEEYQKLFHERESMRYMMKNNFTARRISHINMRIQEWLTLKEKGEELSGKEPKAVDSEIKDTIKRAYISEYAKRQYKTKALQKRLK